MSKKKFAYFDPAWKTERFTCRRCSWSGLFSEMSTETYNEVLDGACPECDTMLFVVSFPTERETEDAATAGNAEAIRMHKEVLEKREKKRRYDHERLTSIDQLPALEGSSLELIFDRRDDGDYVVSYGDREIWREPSFYEDWKRFFAIKELLKQKYGASFKGLRVTPAASLYLLGEDPRAPSLSPE